MMCYAFRNYPANPSGRYPIEPIGRFSYDPRNDYYDNYIDPHPHYENRDELEMTYEERRVLNKELLEINTKIDKIETDVKAKQEQITSLTNQYNLIIEHDDLMIAFLPILHIVNPTKMNVKIDGILGNIRHIEDAITKLKKEKEKLIETRKETEMHLDRLNLCLTSYLHDINAIIKPPDENKYYLLAGGTGETYMKKYLKYKNKYLQLKKKF